MQTNHRLAWITAAVAGFFVLAGSSPWVAAGARARADEAAIRHFVSRASFGVRPADLERARRIGVDAYLEEQLHPESIDDSALETRLREFATLDMSSADIASKYLNPAMAPRRQRAPAEQASKPSEGARKALAPGDAPILAAQRAVMAELTQARMLRAVESERQLQEVLTDFWFNHFNVFAGKAQVRAYLGTYEREAIRPHVFGRFRDMLGAVAHSPAMLIYLDNWQSSAPQEAGSPALEQRLMDPRLTPQARQRLTQRLRQMPARPTRGINENYARELMELHTLGVDAGYTQKDVVELARILTGWTIDTPRQGGAFLFRPAMHDSGTKVFLGQTFGNAGQVEGEKALDMLAAHPATARHLAMKLLRRFVADEPPQALVERIAAVFTGTKGDLRATVRSIFTAPEFHAAEYRNSKVKTPLEFVVSAVRATGATVENAQPLVAAVQNLGMPLYGCQPPTGYGVKASDWVNTGALLARMNLAVDLVGGGRIRPQTTNRPDAAAAPQRPRTARANSTSRPAPIRIDITALAPDTTAASQRVVLDRLLGGSASDATRQTLGRAETPAQLVALALGSPEYQRR